MNKASLRKDREILNNFLENWPLERVKKMDLDEYVNIRDPETFCQFIENKTRLLGSNKGLTSIKFGIYKRFYPNKKSQKFISDDTHTWLPFYGTEKDLAFERIKEDIIKVIIAAKRSELEKIDDIHLYNLFKWKIAFMYSDEGFIPIFNKNALKYISRNLGLRVTNQTKYSEMHRFISGTKPAGISVYDYMRKLYTQYKLEKNVKNSSEETDRKKRKKRKKADSRNTESQTRKGSSTYIANQFHNELQEKLEEVLKIRYGQENVKLEENYVDIKVSLPKEVIYYEVKTAGFAEDCIRQGLGQLLSYIFFEKDSRQTKLVIFGKNRPNLSETDFINFVQSQLPNLEFEYLSLQELNSLINPAHNNGSSQITGIAEKV